jgi:hypothetical protein
LSIIHGFSCQKRKVNAMVLRKFFVLFAAVCVLAFMGAACGNKEGKTEGQQTKRGKEAKSEGDAQQAAREAYDVASLDDEFLEGRRMIENAGFIVKEYANFPVQEIAKKGRILVYTDKKEKQSGGVIYLKITGTESAPAWHWYFQDMVPDSAVKKEINQDGLWDLSIVSTHGKVMDYIQDESFTLAAKERSDWIAENGTSSAPVSPEFGLWKCFDGDTTTAWKSPAGGAFVEFAVPFGVQQGTLALTTLGNEQPRGCTVYADGKQAAQIEIQPVAGRQMFALGEGVRGAKTVRLEFTSVHGNGNAVSVAELGLN